MIHSVAEVIQSAHGVEVASGVEIAPGVAGTTAGGVTGVQVGRLAIGGVGVAFLHRSAVVGHGRDEVIAELAAAGVDEITTVVQEKQLGTGHAVETAMPVLADDVDRVLVLPGDTPLITAEALATLVAADEDVVLLSGVLDDAAGYGRIVRDAQGAVIGIVEHRDATEEQLAIGEFNAGMYVFERSLLAGALNDLDTDNDQGERYLTDVISIARDRGASVGAAIVDAELVAGVNDRVQLAEVSDVLRHRRLAELGRDGVTVLDPGSTWVDVDVQVGRDTVLLPGTMLEHGTTVGERCEIGPNSRLVATEVGDDATVTASHCREAVVGDRATVGPFAHLRPGTVLGAATKAGAFTEIKQATLGEGAKVPHLAYVGDAEIGARANLACGVITVNYDGQDKHRTVVGEDAFIGCDTSLVAPVTVGDGAYVAAGSVITQDVPADALAIARSRQTVKDGWAARRRDDADG
jgi:bifunctional UDP-N-acetylglucosamine pyrophosphorylase/glucosamine-1-phosphate N-acetyltransferase